MQEIEFVCVNNQFTGARPARLQNSLFRALSDVPAVLVYRQNFSESPRKRQISMAAIILDGSAETEREVRWIANSFGVKIDLVSSANDLKVREILDGSLEGLKDYGVLPA